MRSVPRIRIRKANQASVNANGDFVLYWMIAFRRLNWNFSLEQAVAWALELKKPLVILEALRCGYPWASDRLHRFILDGMADNMRQAAKYNVFYYPYVEQKKGAGKGLLSALAKRACVIVTDDYPAFFIPRPQHSTWAARTRTWNLLIQSQTCYQLHHSPTSGLNARKAAFSMPPRPIVQARAKIVYRPVLATNTG